MEHLNNQPIVAAPAKSLWQYFVEAYTQNYFNFKGRARRREYWGIWLFNNLIALAISVIGRLLSDTDAGVFSMLSSMNLTWTVISVLWSIVGCRERWCLKETLVDSRLFPSSKCDSSSPT